MTKILGLIALIMLPLMVKASGFNPGMPAFKGFIPVRSDRELYVDYVAPRPGMPTAVLLNGMTYTTKQWEAYSKALTLHGVGVVRFDFDGMGETLLKYAPSTKAFQWDQQVKDTHALLQAMGLRPPYHFVGLSYGGAMAIGYALMYPREIRNLVLMAPFTEPLEGQDNWIKSQIWLTRRTFPANPASDDDLYEFFLHQIVYATYPQAEPIVLENPFKLEATYNLVRGIRKFRAVDSANLLPAGTVHMMVAANDQYVPAKVLDVFWSKLTPAARMSRILVHDSEHKMPEAVPEFAAAWTIQILKGNPELRGGQVFEGWPRGLIVKTANGRTIPINN